jgi:hypothetical protein
LAASFDKGGLQVQQPSETAEGLFLNLIQKCVKKLNAGTGTKLTLILDELLVQKRYPILSTHIKSLGPGERDTTGNTTMEKTGCLDYSSDQWRTT